MKAWVTFYLEIKPALRQVNIFLIFFLLSAKISIWLLFSHYFLSFSIFKYICKVSLLATEGNIKLILHEVRIYHHVIGSMCRLPLDGNVSENYLHKCREYTLFKGSLSHSKWICQSVRRQFLCISCSLCNFPLKKWKQWKTWGNGAAPETHIKMGMKAEGSNYLCQAG